MHKNETFHANLAMQRKWKEYGGKIGKEDKYVHAEKLSYIDIPSIENIKLKNNTVKQVLGCFARCLS